MKKKEGLLITSSLLDSYAYLQETKNKISAYSDFVGMLTKEYKQYCLLMCIISDEVDFEFWYNKGTL